MVGDVTVMITLKSSAEKVVEKDVEAQSETVYFRQQQEYLGHINGQVEEVYGGHLVVQAYNKQESTIKKFEDTNQILFQSAWKSQFLSGLMQPIMQFVGNLG